MSFTLATIETASGPHAAIVVGDRVIDIAAATGDGVGGALGGADCM